jgi:AsmA-like protein
MRKALLGAVIVLLVGAAGAWIVAQRVLGSDLVRATLERQLSDRLGQPVHIGSATASLFPRVAVDLHDVAIGQPSSVQVGQLQVVTGARGLFSRKIADAELIVRDGQIAWPLPFSLAPPAPPDAPTAQPALTVTSVRRIVFRNVTLVTALPPIALDLDASLDGDRLNIARLTARSGKTRLEASGALASVARLEGRLDVKGDLAFADYAVTNLAATIAVSPERLSLSPLAFAVSGGTFDGRLDVDIRGQVPRLQIKGRVAALDVTTLMKGTQSSGGLTGRLGAQVSATSFGSDAATLLRAARGTIDATVADGTLPHLDMVRRVVLAFGKPSGAPPEGSGTAFRTLGGTFVLASQGLTAGNLSMTSRDLDMQGRASLRLDSGAVDVRADVILSPDLTAQAGSDLRRYAQENGRVIVPATVTGTLRGPHVSIDVAAAARRAFGNELKRRATDFLGGLFKKKKGGG